MMLPKKYRGWFSYDKEKKKSLEEFIEKFDNSYYDKSACERLKYDEIEKACWHLASRYDRVGVLLSIDKKVREKFYDYHKEAIIRAWYALKPLLAKRDKIKGEKSYKYFQEIGKYLEERSVKNKPKIRKCSWWYCKMWNGEENEQKIHFRWNFKMQNGEERKNPDS